MVSGFLLKLIRESAALTQVQLAERLGVDVASVQGWESGRRPIAALRTADLFQLKTRLLRCGAQMTLLSMVDDAIRADLIITAGVEAGGRIIAADEHPLGGAVHQRQLTNLITWPLTGMVPAPLRGHMASRARRGPVPNKPVLTAAQQTHFFDHLLVTADASRNEIGALARRQAIYLLSFDPRRSTADWLHTEQFRTLCTTGRIDHIPSWITARSGAVALANRGDREPLRAFLRSTVLSDVLERANLSYWAYWVGEIDGVQVNDEFMGRVDPRGWSGVRLLEHLLERLQPSSAHAELNLHTLWALLLAHLYLQSHLRSAVGSKVEALADDRDLSGRARRELSDIAYAVRLGRR
jgi:DNA-binding XRE family transcriptional regulator